MPILATTQSFIVGIHLLDPSVDDDYSTWPQDEFDTDLTNRLRRYSTTNINNKQLRATSWLERICIVNKWPVTFGSINRRTFSVGSCVLYRSPIDPDRLMAGRVIARANDRIYPSRPKEYANLNDWMGVEVERGHVWLESDSGDLVDSNLMASIPLGLVIGRVVSKPFDPQFNSTLITRSQLTRTVYRPSI